MPKSQSPAITRRRLRAELKSLREGKGLSQADVVKDLDWSLSKLTRIENGSVSVSVTDARALLTVYGASEDQVEELVSLARAARERRWWSGYSDVLAPAVREFLGFEADATRMRQFHPTVVPALLQTEAYAHTLGAPLMLDSDQDEGSNTVIEVRLQRQKHVLGGKNPPDYTVIMDEGLLHRQVGGIDTMQAQLRKIAELEEGGTVSIGILPFSIGSHFGMTGDFHILEFDDEVDHPVLYLGNAQGGVTLRDKPDLVAQYGKRFEDLLQTSVRGAAAVALLHKISDGMS